MSRAELVCLKIAVLEFPLNCCRIGWLASVSNCCRFCMTRKSDESTALYPGGRFHEDDSALVILLQN